jgi:hypothetical protein
MKKKTEPVWAWLGYGSREDMVWELEHHDRYFYYKDQMYGLSMEYARSKEGNPCFSIQYRDPDKECIFNYYNSWDELIDNVVIDGIPFVEILEKGLTD